MGGGGGGVGGVGGGGGVFFFFKQKTAYEIYQCDWSSDVCSSDLDSAQWTAYHNGHHGWEFVEFGWRCDSWGRLYRALYTRAVSDPDGQRLLEFARPDNVILTNLGVNAEVLAHASADERRHWTAPATIIASHHRRGADELPHRGLKEFGFEELPFKRFAANAAV